MLLGVFICAQILQCNIRFMRECEQIQNDQGSLMFFSNGKGRGCRISHLEKFR